MLDSFLGGSSPRKLEDVTQSWLHNFGSFPTLNPHQIFFFAEAGHFVSWTSS